PFNFVSTDQSPVRAWRATTAPPRDLFSSTLLSWPRGRGGRLRSAARVPLENSRRGKFAELVAHHVLGHEQLHEVLAVVDHERVADEIGHDGAIARPRPDRLAAAVALLLL